MRRNYKLMKEYMKSHPNCEKCGRFLGCEVHHKIALSIGGKDDFSNYITLCYECHNEEHIKNRSKLTKIGLERARSKEVYKAIKVIDLYRIIHDITSNGDNVSVREVFDIIDEMPACAWVE